MRPLDALRRVVDYLDATEGVKNDNDSVAINNYCVTKQLLERHISIQVEEERRVHKVARFIGQAQPDRTYPSAIAASIIAEVQSWPSIEAALNAPKTAEEAPDA